MHVQSIQRMPCARGAVIKQFRMLQENEKFRFHISKSHLTMLAGVARKVSGPVSDK